MTKQQDEAARQRDTAQQPQHPTQAPTPWGTPETNDAREQREQREERGEQQRRGDTPVVEGTQQQGVYGDENFTERPTPFMAPERERDTWELNAKGDVVDNEDAWDSDDGDDDELHIEPPTLPSLEERLDEMEARLEQLESFEPVRGEQELPAIDHVHRKKVRAKRRKIREKQEAKAKQSGKKTEKEEKEEEEQERKKKQAKAEKEREERAAR